VTSGAVTVPALQYELIDPPFSWDGLPAVMDDINASRLEMY
jgi:hypothetical protein